MKTFIVFSLLITAFPVFSQIGIGTNTPDSSSALDVSSSEKGILLPRLSTAERDLISSPSTGLFIFNTTTKTLNFYNGVRWKEYFSSLATFNCSGQSTSGVLYPSISASGVSIDLPYILGNGSAYSSISFPSTGVLGLTATLSAGTLANGNGTLTFQITGTPVSLGTAIFSIDLFGQLCNLEIDMSSTCVAGSGLGLNDLNGGTFTIDGDVVNTTIIGTSSSVTNSTASISKCDITTGNSFFYSTDATATIVINFDRAVNNVKLIDADLFQDTTITISTNMGALSLNDYVNNCPTDFIISGNALSASSFSFPNGVVDISSTIAYTQIAIVITNLVTSNNYIGFCFEGAITP